MDSTAAVEATCPWPGRCWPIIHSVGRFTQEERAFQRDYRNEFLTLHLFSYTCQMYSGPMRLDIRPDTLVITPPHATQTFDIPAPGVHWALLVQAQHALGGPLALPRHRALSSALAIEMRSRLERIHEDDQRGGRNPQHPASLAASAGAQALLCWLAAQEIGGWQGGGRKQASALRKAEELLANPTCAKLSITEIAKRVGMSQNRLAAAFRLRHGMTMAKYRRRALTAFAQQWLESTDVSMSTIAERIELPDARRFNKFFRHAVGMSPTAWRRTHAPVVNSSARPPLDIDNPPEPPPPPSPVDD